MTTQAVPLPGAAHPGFPDIFVAKLLSSPVGGDGTIRQYLDQELRIFRPAQSVIPYTWIVWWDDLGRGIAQPTGQFMVETPTPVVVADPVFVSGAHINLPVQPGPPPFPRPTS